MGLLDGIGKFLQSSKGQGNFTDRLGMFGASLQDIDDGGNRASGLRQQQQQMLAQQQAQERRAQLAAMADQIGLSPKEKLLFMVNPEAFGSLLKDQQSPYTMSKGQQRFGPNGLVAETPDTQVMGDQLFSVGSQGATPIARRDKTYGETLDEQRATEVARHNLAQEALGKGQLGVSQGQLGVSRGQLGVSRGRLGLSQKEYQARLKGVGGFGTPGVGNVLGSTLNSDWEIQ